MEVICKLSGASTTWPCSAASCPLFGDCLTAYQKMSVMPGVPTSCIKGVPQKVGCKACDIRNACPVYSAPPEDVPVMTNEEWLKSLPKGDLASTIHAFHLGYSPWCDHHCKEYADDGCDNCVAKWLKMPATEPSDARPSVASESRVIDIVQCTSKHISTIKRGDKILLLGHNYVAHSDACQDMSHPCKEWHVEVQSLENGLYECLYESSFMHGMTVVLPEEIGAV